MTRFGARCARPSPTINVTPLVDVVLVLLIIFMVVLPAMEHQVPVAIPSIFHVDEHPRGGTDPMTVSVTRDARFFLESEPVSREELEVRLSAIHEAEPHRRVVIRGDAAVDYGVVRNLFRTCQRIGFSGVSLRVGERDEESRENI
jgi:biopolymer transport protein ExbD/biopolymer transport protein TolR